MIGKTISHYKILEKLGEGGMGVVYKAEDTKLDRTVALKFLTQQALGSDEEKARFVHEAKAAAALSHPNICTVHEIDESEGQTFIAMECVEGHSLKGRIESGPLKLDEAVDIAIQVAEGLQEAHEKGIVHRDIKPANVMITAKGQAKIMDFGLAKAPGRTKLTKTGMTLGTAAYMSPEQARGEEADQRSDIWSLGIVLYEMISGRVPFGANYEQALVYSILNEPPEPLTGLRTGVPMDLERIVNKVLAKRPDERYQHMGEMLVDLRLVRKKLEPGAVKPGPIERGKPPGRRFLLYGGIVVVLAVVVVGRSYFFQEEGEPIDSIAVLPLENLSRDPDEDYFADGMTDELIADLAQVEALRVISRTSIIQYKGTKRPLPDIARDLNVDAIVEGTVRRYGDRVRITAQLIHGPTDRHLWAGKFDREFKDVLALHSELSRAIVDEIEIRLTPNEEDLLARRREVVPDAYEAYLRARALMEEFTPDSFERCYEYFKLSIQKDPTFAPAHAALASAYAADGLLYTDQRHYSEAKVAVTKAMELDPRLAEAYAALGSVRYIFEWDWDGADRAFRKGLELNPNNADLHAEYANYLTFMGRFDEALVEYRRALSLSPLSIRTNQWLGWCYYVARRYADSIEQFKKTLGLLEEFPSPEKELQIHKQLTWNYILSGMYDEALAEIEERFPDDWERTWLYAVSGRREEVEGSIEEILSDPEVHPWKAAILGEVDLAFKKLESRYEEHRSTMLFLRVAPGFDNMRSDARFGAMLRRMKFPVLDK